jgi:GrpB-like predicted nucleotidyltransferase (UPF0157 family)
VNDRFELIGGQEHRTISIVPYDHSWPAMFERHRERIEKALGRQALRIDHIGSTAVVGLAAKPIIDIDLSVEDSEDERSYVPALERAEYRLRVRERGHRMLRTPQHDVHLHVCAIGSDWERRHLLFRDWLRADPDDRQLYAEAKRELAARGWPDMNAYATAKTEIIDAITKRAEGWACGR